jgi:hypothetical protein
MTAAAENGIGLDAVGLDLQKFTTGADWSE